MEHVENVAPYVVFILYVILKSDTTFLKLVRFQTNEYKEYELNKEFKKGKFLNHLQTKHSDFIASSTAYFSSLNSENVSTIIPNTTFMPMVVMIMKNERSKIVRNPGV